LYLFRGNPSITRGECLIPGMTYSFLAFQNGDFI
jgi:hypothetical protein